MKRNPVSSFRHCAAAILCGLGILAAGHKNAAAQGVIDPAAILQTGTGNPLTTAVQSIFLPASTVPMQIQIAVGFSTDETFAPETFFDSVTLTLSDDLASLAAIFFTMDCSGAFWAPTPGGGIPVDANSIERTSIEFPDLTPVHANQVAYYLTLPVPASLTGRQLNLYLDLFDNQNSAGSLAWMSQVTVVPEPATAALIALGMFCFAFRRNSKV
ncbi:MAG TPA: PEP-CTERM sorting domain-containing protein [Verrucomicrobiae bacterium]